MFGDYGLFWEVEFVVCIDLAEPPNHRCTAMLSGVGRRHINGQWPWDNWFLAGDIECGCYTAVSWQTEVAGWSGPPVWAAGGCTPIPLHSFKPVIHGRWVSGAGIPGDKWRLVPEHTLNPRQLAGPFAIIDKKTNSQVYQDILEDNIRVAACQLKLSVSCVMQQENYLKYWSKSTTEWLQKNINPPFGMTQSILELNPLEILWNDAWLRLLLPKEDWPAINSKYSLVRSGRHTNGAAECIINWYGNGADAKHYSDFCPNRGNIKKPTYTIFKSSTLYPSGTWPLMTASASV